jgi:hypothetical protein
VLAVHENCRCLRDLWLTMINSAINRLEGADSRSRGFETSQMQICKK